MSTDPYIVAGNWPDPGPPMRLLARPEAPALTAYTRRLLVLRKHRIVSCFTYSTGHANWLLLMHPDDGRVERFAVPNHEKGSHGAALGADGNIYTVTHEGGFHRFLVEQRQWETLPHRLPAGEMPWDACGAPDGAIYFGTYPNTIFGRYDIATGEWWLHPNTDPTGKYLFNFHARADGRIQCRGIGGEKHIVVFDPSTRTFTRTPFEMPPPQAYTPSDPAQESMTKPIPPEGDERVTACLLPDPRSGNVPRNHPRTRMGVASFSGRICRVAEDGRSEVVAQLPGPPEAWHWVTGFDDHTMVGVSYLGRWFAYNATTGRLHVEQLPTRAPDANEYYYFTAPDDRWLVGGHYSQQNAFRVNQETGEWESSPGMICRKSGEPTASVSLNGKAYLGIYIHALMLEYDPNRPFEYGVNPREVLQTGHDQSRPRGMSTDGRRIFMATWHEYCGLGGAMTVYEPATGSHRVFPGVLPDQNLDAIAWDEKTRRVIGGTYRWGDSESFPPRAATAVVYAWDPDSGCVTGQVAPWPDADLIQVRGVLPGGIAVAVRVSNYEVALIDTATMCVLHVGAFPLGALRAMCVTPSNIVYGLTSEGVFRWRPEDHLLTPLAHVKSMRYLAVPAPGRIIVAGSTAIHRIDVTEQGQ